MTHPIPAGQRPESTFIAHPLAWLLAWAVLHVLSRLWISPALELDEAQQMLWTQELALGYGTQPPLYTWLQWVPTTLIGPSVLSLSLLKVGLLALTYLFMWKAAREFLPARAAWWAAAGMTWFPLMGWESLRDLTHSVLVSCLVAATWWSTFALLRRPAPRRFVLLGLALGLGVLSKYSFALFAAALGLAALSIPETRRALFSRGWWWLPVTVALVVAPHGAWLLDHWAQASQGTMNKLQVHAAFNPLAAVLGLGQAVLANVLLWLLMALAVFGRGWWRTASSPLPTAPAPANWIRPLLLRYLLLVLACLLAMVFIGHAMNIKPRWLHPLLCVLPLAAFVLRPSLNEHPRGRWYTWGTVALALLFWGLVTARPWINASHGKINEIHTPIVALAEQLRAAGYDSRGTIVSNDDVLAGSLRTRFPQARVVVCASPAPVLSTCLPQVAHPADRGLLLVTSTAPTGTPGWWSADPAAPVHSVKLPYQNAPAQAAPATFQFQWLPKHP